MNFLENSHGFKIRELACDFIKDDNNVWWFTNCKAFQYTEKVLENPSILENIEEGGYQRLKRCRLC